VVGGGLSRLQQLQQQQQQQCADSNDGPTLSNNNKPTPTDGQ